MKRALYPIAGLVGVLVTWEIARLLFHPHAVVWPSLQAVWSAVLANFPTLLRETVITLSEATAGLAAGSVGAYGAAVMFVLLPGSRAALYPYAVALKATPLVALAPLIVMWFGNGFGSKVVMSAMVAFFPVLVGSVSGLTSVDPGALDLFRSLGASPKEVMMKLRVPASLEQVLPSLKVASSLAVVGAVIGEFTGASYGIGRVITGASYYLDTPLMFAAIGALALGSLVLFGAISLAETRLIHGRRAQ